MDIRIANYVAASFLLEQEPNRWHAVVILDSDLKATEFVEDHSRSHCCLRFDDVEEPCPNKEPPTNAMMEEGLSFAKGKDKLLVSCRAGQGRSAALAFVISCRENGVAEALKLLDPTRHRPNRSVVRIGATLLGEPFLLSQFDQWRRSHSHIRLSDYYDEIEQEMDALEELGASNRICVPHHRRY